MYLKIDMSVQGDPGARMGVKYQQEKASCSEETPRGTTWRCLAKHECYRKNYSVATTDYYSSFDRPAAAKTAETLDEDGSISPRENSTLGVSSSIVICGAFDMNSPPKYFSTVAEATKGGESCSSGVTDSSRAISGLREMNSEPTCK